MTELAKDPIQEALQQAFSDIDIKAELARAGETGMEWLPQWYTRTQGEVEDSLARLETVYQATKKQLENEISALNFRWGRDLRLEIDRQFSEGEAKGKKSIRNLFGKVGYRKVPSRISVVIDDEAVAIESAVRACPEVIKKTISKTRLGEYFESTGEEIAGTHIEKSKEYQKFYIKPEQKLLT